MIEEIIVAVAKATGAASETTGKLIEATSKLCRIFKGPIADAVGILEDRVKFARWTLAVTQKRPTRNDLRH